MKKRKKRKYTNGSTRLMKMPIKYQEDFLERIDERTTLYNNLSKSFKQVVLDLGGADNLSRLEISLCERFVYVEMLIRNLETKGVNGDEEDFLDRYQKLTNSLNSICQKLGVVKRKVGESQLKQYLDEQE